MYIVHVHRAFLLDSRLLLNLVRPVRPPPPRTRAPQTSSAHPFLVAGPLVGGVVLDLMGRECSA